MAVDFPSPSSPLPLPPRFAKIKAALIAGHEASVSESFIRLLSRLQREADHIVATGPAIVPTIDYFDIHDSAKVAAFRAALRERGVAIIRRVVPPNVALAWKEETCEYLRHNAPARGFPSRDPQLFDVFWSPGQVKARADSRVLEVQRFAMGAAWQCTPSSSSSDPSLSSSSSNNKTPHGNTGALVSTTHPVTYADQLRIRHPGDISLASGPHIDGGSVERWEPDGYGRAGTYSEIFAGRWEDHDPWDARARLSATSDLYNSAGSCSMFRMFQGFLSLSSTPPGSASLRVCPMLRLSTAYLLLRPFFFPSSPPSSSSSSSPDFLCDSNWALCTPPDSVIQGAVPGRGAQLLNEVLHPHLRLSQTMVPIPAVEPGDYVLWHPDLAHALGAVHVGLAGPAALYVPACPLTLPNALYLARQRRAFLLGRPAPDYESYGAGGGGDRESRRGEQTYLGRPGVQDVNDAGGEEGLRSMGLLPWEEKMECMRDDSGDGEGEGEGEGASEKKMEVSRAKKELLRQANGILFPDRFDTMYKRRSSAERLFN
ncbi:hypothetical protein AAE478_009245 [Parahypoxylon ruwenzoriense]